MLELDVTNPKLPSKNAAPVTVVGSVRYGCCEVTWVAAYSFFERRLQGTIFSQM